MQLEEPNGVSVYALSPKGKESQITIQNRQKTVDCHQNLTTTSSLGHTQPRNP